jgi:3-oxoacyl-[acyl-carrier protein] reductase
MKTILLTGAGGSIGSYIIKSFYKNYNLICVDKNKDKLNAVKKKYGRITIYSCDLTKTNEVKKLLKNIIKNKTIDILINNAGTIYSEPLIKFKKKKFKCHSYKSWLNIINANLNSTFLISSNIIEHLCNLRKESLIINISSIAALGNKGQSAYSASKSAIETLTKVWAKELADFNIRVTCISPGFFNTDSTKRSLSNDIISDIVSSTPSKRMGTYREFTGAINFIIKNKFFNGKILSIDGGFVL